MFRNEIGGSIREPLPLPPPLFDEREMRLGLALAASGPVQPDLLKKTGNVEGQEDEMQN
jgi:hypothetical protein